MHTTEIEIKAIAKAVGASLGRQGHKVPQSIVLHALAAALDKRDWNTLKSAVKGLPALAAPALKVVVEQLTDELPSAYSDQARFWVKLAYLAGKPLRTIPDSSEEALRIARENVGPTHAGLLKWGGWNLPADFNYADSTLDAGDFKPGTNSVGMFTMQFDRPGLLGTLQLEVGYAKGTGWYASKSGVAMLFAQVESLVSDELVIDATSPELQASLPGPEVSARFYTDDHAFEADFDAQAYLMVSNDSRLTEIINAGYGGDYCTDNIAEYFGDKKLNQDIVDGFAYLSYQQRSRFGETIGFECRVDGKAFLQWMHKHRPLALARELCSRAGVQFVQAEEEEIRGMWDWLEGQGNACECSFHTEEEAILDAYQRLGLLESECRDAPSFG